jgi:signal transduction histidine kinase
MTLTRRPLLIIYSALCLAWLAFALGQYKNYRQQLVLIEESLQQQSQSIMTALVGGIGSHRRVGQYFEAQMQALLDELAEAADVIAVAIYGTDQRPILAAGEDMSASDRSPADPAAHVFHLAQTFELQPLGPGQGGGRGPGGGGRGRGLGPRRWNDEAGEASPFAAGGTFRAELWLGRTRADVLMGQAYRSYLWSVAAAGLVAACLGVAWRATVKLADARGLSRVYQIEARHLRELSQAAAGLAHETRNPLGLIRGWTQRLAQSRMSEEERQQYAHAVMEECDRVTARINQFLAFARPREPELTAVEIAAMCRELSVVLQPDLEAAGVTLTWDIASAARYLRADYELLRQALFNLMQNATEFSPHAAQVEVLVRPQHDHTVAIQVVDRGPGVPDAARESLFSPYFTTRAAGTGLGLAIVRHIATLHGWQASYQPREGGGASFELTGIHVADPEDHSDRG